MLPSAKPSPTIMEMPSSAPTMASSVVGPKRSRKTSHAKAAATKGDVPPMKTTRATLVSINARMKLMKAMPRANATTRPGQPMARKASAVRPP